MITAATTQAIADDGIPTALKRKGSKSEIEAVRKGSKKSKPAKKTVTETAPAATDAPKKEPAATKPAKADKKPKAPSMSSVLKSLVVRTQSSPLTNWLRN